MPPRYQRSGAFIDASVSPSGRALPVKSYQYDAVIDLMLLEPGISLSEIARRLGKSPAWMTWLTKSDAFRDMYEERRRLKNQQVHEELHLALTKVARQGLDILSTRMEKNPNAVGIQQALDVADKALERLGYGVKLPGTLIDARSQMQVVLSEADFAKAQAVVRGLEAENAAKPGASPPVLASPVARDTRAPPAALEELLAKSGFGDAGDGESARSVQGNSWSSAAGGNFHSPRVASPEEADDGGEEEWPSLSEED